MSRRTEIGYKARATGASEQMVAKLPWSKGPCVNPAVVGDGHRRRREVPLPGEISPRARKGDTGLPVEREVSRGHNSGVSIP